MPQQLPAEPALTGIFQALADPTRLAVVERLSIAPASASELARPFPMALSSFMQHMGVLETAGIVTSHKSGRTRTYQLAPDTLQLAATWLATFRPHWERRLDQLDHLLITTAHTAGPAETVATGTTATSEPIAGKTKTTTNTKTPAEQR